MINNSKEKKETEAAGKELEAAEWETDKRGDGKAKEDNSYVDIGYRPAV
jgi:hypothetical protein